MTTTYNELVKANKDNIIIEYKIIIDNSTLKYFYSISTNLHCDFGICDEMMNCFSSASKSKFNRQMSEYKRLSGLKSKLVKTENDDRYTRLVYRIEKANK